MEHTLNLTSQQESGTARLASLPDIRNALLDPKSLGATVCHRFYEGNQCDIPTLAISHGEARYIYHDSEEEAWLCCRLEELILGEVAPKRLRLALRNLPHTVEHETQRSNRVQS